MLTKRLRSQIEWHFYNYPADMALYNERVREIAESGLTVNYDRIGSGGNTPGSPTERKAIMLEALEQERSWATVVRNTFVAFQFEPEYEIMTELYINRTAKASSKRTGLCVCVKTALKRLASRCAPLY